MTTPVLYDDEGNETPLPFKWCICSDCNGHGKSSAYLGAITQSDREPGGSWEDPDDFACYMSGGYDKRCDTCDGTGKVQVVDDEKLTKEQRKQLREQRQADREYAAEVAAERRFGC
jgi:hypothetical protein